MTDKRRLAIVTGGSSGMVSAKYDDAMSEVADRPLRALVEEHRDEIRAVVSKNRGVDVAIFGSVARGDETIESDIDFLVDLEDDASLFDEGRMLYELRDLLGCSVDIVDRASLTSRDAEILHDAVRL